MSDYERYGDYNDVEDDLPKSKNPIIIILKLLIALICVGVIGILGFRLIIFNYYPDSVKNVYFNDALTEHYDERDGDIVIKTQKLLAPYDDNVNGNFFCDNLYLVDEIDQLQITVRYNKSLIDSISKELDADLDDKSAELFDFRLVASFGEGDMRTYDTVSDTVFDSFLMYRYHKLVFDAVEFDTETQGSPYWIRLEVVLKSDPSGKSYKIPIYQNEESYSDFDIYSLSGEEKPE